jgi:hypothetical protein
MTKRGFTDGMGDAETLACILSDVRDKDDRRAWEPSDNVRLRADGTIDVPSLNWRQFQMYSTLLEEALEDSQRLGRVLGKKDKQAWRAVRRRELRERQQKAFSLRRMGVALLASPIMLLVWVFDALSSGRHDGVARTRGRAAVQGGGNRLMALVVMLFLVMPLVSVATGDGGYFPLVLVVMEACLAAVYAPWYTLLMTVPFLYAWAAVGGIAYGTHFPPEWWVIGIWVWSLYPMLRGLYHVTRWEKERKAYRPNHAVSQHPWALAATSVLVAIGGHYALKEGAARPPGTFSASL